MSQPHSDALVFFGATGDLAYKKIFPALQSMIKRGNLNVPVVGVAKAGWNLDQLKARAKDSLEQHGGLDPAAWAKLSSLLHYVDGDYSDSATFTAVRKELGSAERPAHYLAIPPSLFEKVVEQLVQSGSAKGARIIVEKPFGHDLASAQELNRILLSVFPESSIFRIDHYLAKAPVHNMVSFRFSNSFWSRSGTGITSRVCKSQWQRISACRAGALFTIRPVRFVTSSRTISSRSCAILPWSALHEATVSPYAMKKLRC